MGQVICGIEAVEHVAKHGGALRRGEFGGGSDSCGDVIDAAAARALVESVGREAVYCEEGEDDEAAFIAALDSMEKNGPHWVAGSAITIAVGGYLRGPSPEKLDAIRRLARSNQSFPDRLNPIESGVSALRNALSSHAHTRHNGFVLARHRAAARIEQVVDVVFPPDTYPAFR